MEMCPHMTVQVHVNVYYTYLNVNITSAFTCRSVGLEFQQTSTSAIKCAYVLTHIYPFSMNKNTTNWNKLPDFKISSITLGQGQSSYFHSRERS